MKDLVIKGVVVRYLKMAFLLILGVNADVAASIIRLGA